MADLDDVTTALAAQIERITGLKMFGELPDQINPPCGAVLPGSPLATYGITLGEAVLPGAPHLIPVPTDYNLVVGVFVSRAPSLQRAQATVKQYLGMKSGGISIPRAIMEDSTLGGVVEYCVARSVIAFGNVEIGGQQYFQGRITVQVSAVEEFG